MTGGTLLPQGMVSGLGMGWRCWSLIAAIATSAPGFAADKPDFSAPAAWIKPLASPTAAIPQDTAALHVLLNDAQVAFHGDTTRTFTSAAIQVAKPEGLTALGTFSLAWKPDTDRVFVHWLRIRRGGQLIDVLNGGKQFTILRREQNLELATIDGMLTATMPIPGLQLGDIVEYASTIERTEPLVRGHHDLVVDAGTAGNVARLGIAAQWDDGDHVVVRSHNLPATPVSTANSLALVAGAVEPLVLPQSAPARYRLGRVIELSDYPDWAAVSATFAPLYTSARQLKPDSLLHAEIARIKAASSEPAARAGLALKLVEDNVRYLFIGLNDGNLQPALADDTWQRRFGDCKAKTALLLALLDGLGIAAEPALISTRLGDGLDERLPNASQFDHVMVRATIAGKIYWLDGTRVGDRNLADLEVPNFHWALPLQASGGALQALVVPPQIAPSRIVDLHLDASRGIMSPAVAHVESTFTGDAGLIMHSSISAVSKGALDQQLRDYWSQQYDFITPGKVEQVWDEATRTERFIMDGTARMAWNDAGNAQLRYELDGYQVGRHADFRRQPGPDNDAPFAIDYPYYTEFRETVLLPNGGGGFSLSGEDVDRTLAQFAIFRRTQLSDGRVTMVARQRPLAPELSYAAAQAANDALRSLADVAVDIMLDQKQYLATAEDAKALIAQPSDSSEARFLVHLNGYEVQADAAGGLAEARRYLAAFPQSGKALGARAMFEAASNMKAQALADANAALAIEADNRNAKLAIAYYGSGQDDGLAASFFAWQNWGIAERCRQQRNYACAISKSEAAVAQQPGLSMAYVTLANSYRAQGRDADALAVADRMTAAAPRNADMQAVAGIIYCSLGRRDKGLSAFSASLAIKPNFTAYANRYRFLTRSDLAGRKRDIDAALKLRPDDKTTMLALAQWQGESGDHAAQAATLQTVAAQNAASAEPDIRLTINIGQAYAGANQPDKARENFAEARGYAAASKNGEFFNELCYQAAKVNFDLDTALGDCNRAIGLLPMSSAVQDSLGFVQLRLGHLAEAVAAYDRALAINPREVHSMYGRGVAYARQGNKDKGKADVAAALLIDPEIADEFHQMGVQP